MVGRPSRRSRRGRDAVRKCRKWLVGPPVGPGVVVSPTPEVQQWSVGPTGGPGVVRTPSRRSGSGRDALPEVREWSEALPEVRQWLGGFPEGP